MQKTKKVVSLLITLCVLMAFVPNYIVHADSVFSGGNGNETEPYLIASADDFKQLAEDVNGGNDYKGKYFKIPDTVTETIVLSTEDGFTPIGDENHSFDGIFDGGNHTININLTGKDNLGLFGQSGRNSEIRNVKTTGSVTAQAGSYYVGGVVAELNGKIENCHNAASVTGSTQIGGVAGIADNSYYIINCSNSGSIDGSMNVGGVVGNVGPLNLVNCFNTGEVKGNNAGGVVGITGNRTQIYNCVNNGKVTKNYDNAVIGGVLGDKDDNTTIDKCYYNSSINSGLYDFGTLNYDTTCTTTNFAKTSEEIVSDDVINSLNVYAKVNKPNDITLRYWEVKNGEFAFTETPTVMPYAIANNSPDNITIKSTAMAGEEVSFTVKENSYSTFEVVIKDSDGNDITSIPTDDRYSFTMPASDVTISTGNTKLKLKKENEVYQIETADDMKLLSEAVNNGYDTKGNSFALKSDISLSTENGFTPIGNENHSFEGTFDGGNHTINLSLTGKDNVGLFGKGGENSYIRNVKTNGSVVGGDYYIGGVVAEMKGKIENCHNAATVKGTYQVGGVAGISDNSNFIINCSNSGNIDGTMNVGGIVGNVGPLNIVNCFNTGEVKGDCAGGIVGITGTRTQIYNCVNNGKVIKKYDNNVIGGIIGNKYNSTTIDKCYYNSTINIGVYDFGAIDGKADDATTTNFAKTSEEIVSNDVVNSLNLYARDNKPNDITLLYWEVTDGKFAFTQTTPNLPYTITNNKSDYLTISESAMPNASVEINTDKVPSYLKIKKITVNGDRIDVNSDGKYVFTMPEANVTIDADFEVKLQKNEYNGNYIISTAEELIIFSKAVNSSFAPENVELTADVTASTKDGFEPIGTEANPYKGYFNGKGHTITLEITSGTQYNDTTATGLFGVLSNANIKNLVLKGSVDGGNDTSSYTGAVAGAVDRYSDLYNIYSEVSVSGSGYVGGLIGYSKASTYFCGVINNGTATQKNTEADKKAVGAMVGIGNDSDNYIAIYNSDKNSGVFFTGYDSDGNKVTEEDLLQAMTTEKLFSDEIMDRLNMFADSRGYMYWNFVTENGVKTAKLVEEIPAPVYYINSEDTAIIQAPYCSRAGKTISVEIDLSNDTENMISSVKGIKVTDAKGNAVKVNKTDDDTYEFVMPENHVIIQTICDYNIAKDSNGVYYITDEKDLIIFSRIVEKGQADANAKIIAKNIDSKSYTSYDKGLIGTNTPYKGTFDGNGANISLYGALFDKTDGAVIKNLNITDESYASKVAGVVRTANNTHIDNCDVSMHMNSDRCGGIAVEAYNSTITNSCVTVNGYTYNFGGIVYSTSGNTVIANCVLRDSNVNADSIYGGIVGDAKGKTEIYNCANNDIPNSGCEYIGGIVSYAEMSGLTLENNLYNNSRISYYDVCYDSERDQALYATTDKNSKVNSAMVAGLYIPAKLNEYVRANPNRIEGTTLKTWSINNDEICFADRNNPELYLINHSGIDTDTFVDGVCVYGAFYKDKVTVSGVVDGAKVTVTDSDGNDVTVTADDNGYVFKMPKSDVTVSVVLDTGISETTEIDGKTYVVVKTADDFIKAVKSISEGNSCLNVYIDNDIELTAENLKAYPKYTDDTPRYDGIFDGAGHTVTFDGLKQSMLYEIGRDGVVKNITVDGTISSINNTSNDDDENQNELEIIAAGVAITNNGLIMNCINKADISGVEASGIVRCNDNILFGCMNKGDITGSTVAAAITTVNENVVIMATNEGTITNPSSNGNLIGNNGNSGLVQDFSNTTDSSAFKTFAAQINSVIKSIKSVDSPEVALIADALEWSVSITDTSTEFVFADSENLPYYMFASNDYKAYKAGDTVEFTIDPTEIGDDFVISDVTVETDEEKIKISAVDGKENTFSFTMPNDFCRLVIKTVAKGVEKDENGYYLVGTLDELKKVKQTIENGNDDINIKLTDNIKDYDGSPIGGDYGYNGIFDGNGHSITLAMNSVSDDSDDDYYGLFGKLNSDAVVKNLKIEGSVHANASYIGSVAGVCYGSIMNCVNNATVTNDGDSHSTGGIVGNLVVDDTTAIYSLMSDESSVSAHISNCVNNGEISGYNVGGIVALVSDRRYSTAKITDCVNNGKINATGEAGGIINGGNYTVITNCTNNAEIKATNTAGGIAGNTQNVQNGKISIVNSVNNGNVNSNYMTGGIAGYCYDVEIINSANNGSVVSNNGYASGIVGTNGKATVKNCFNSGNVSGSDDSYAIAYYDYRAGRSDDSLISNSFYLRTADVNNNIYSSNINYSNDISAAVSEDDIKSYYVVAMLNGGVTSGLSYWDVKDGKVVFTDDESELYYSIEIDKNIKGGTITADKKFAKAGEKVTLTITPETTGQLPIIAGVEVDENNSFVMPDRKVTISAVFGDTFTGTDKNDVIELMQDKAMEEVKLADYVKFVNDDISRDFVFTVADGSSLPEGLKLSYGRISGTPTSFGTYTVVFDVKDSGVSLMSLDSDTALDNAQLTLTFNIAEKPIEPIGKYADKVAIEKEVKEDNVVFTVTPLSDDMTNELTSLKLFVAEYDSNGQLIGIKLGANEKADGKVKITTQLPTTNNYKFMLWSKSNCPIINAITKIK